MTMFWWSFFTYRKGILKTSNPYPHSNLRKAPDTFLGGRFGYILFFLVGGGSGRVQAARGGEGSDFYQKSGGGSPRREEGGGGEPLEGVCGEIWGEGGLNISFRGRNSHQGLNV